MRPLFISTAIALALIGAAADAQVHVAERGVYTVRANAIASDWLPAAIANAHGIQRDRERGVLNVVVLERRDAGQRTIPAQVVVTVRNLLGQEEPITMRTIKENGRVSYLGTFAYSPLRHLRFSITATPAGASQALTVEFDDTFVARDS